MIVKTLEGIYLTIVKRYVKDFCLYMRWIVFMGFEVNDVVRSECWTFVMVRVIVIDVVEQPAIIMEVE